MKLYYQSAGEGAPLLILHGLFGSSDNWRGIAKQLAAERQVISVDLRNHGRSPHNDEQNFTTMAEDIRELCDDLQLDKVLILGHSLGGKVAMQFAAMYPEKVLKLIVVDIAPRQYQDEHSTIFEALLAVDLKQFTKRSEVDAVLAEKIPSSSGRQFLLMNLSNGGNGLQWRINLQALHSNYPHLLQSVCDDKRISTPALFIRGAKSDYIAEADDELIRNRFSQALVHTVADAGHWVHADQPVQFIHLVREFINHD